jgi:hypothetical protein
LDVRRGAYEQAVVANDDVVAGDVGYLPAVEARAEAEKHDGEQLVAGAAGADVGADGGQIGAQVGGGDRRAR